ncbi:hypothetical protein SFRURICE_014217 [Spodoptera frugiperda]|nr:hypothetical protein SFRURICE_014217 [Spodoptera frugiperda]
MYFCRRRIVHVARISYDVIGIADDAVRTMRISGRSCMSFYTRQNKIHCVGCIRCRPVDAYLYSYFILR